MLIKRPKHIHWLFELSGVIRFSYRQKYCDIRGTVVRPIRRNRVIAQPQEHLEGSSFDQTLLAI